VSWFSGRFPTPPLSARFIFFLLQQNVTRHRRNILDWKQFLRFTWKRKPHAAVSLRAWGLGSQTTSVSKPDVFVRRNGFIPHYGQEHQRRRAQHSMSYYVKLCLVYKTWFWGRITHEPKLQKFEHILTLALSSHLTCIIIVVVGSIVTCKLWCFSYWCQRTSFRTKSSAQWFWTQEI